MKFAREIAEKSDKSTEKDADFAIDELLKDEPLEDLVLLFRSCIRWYQLLIQRAEKRQQENSCQ